MPFRRRRPLLRAAAVGGTAYAVGKHSQKRQQQEETQDAQIDDLQGQADEQQQAAPEVPDQGTAPMSEADRVSALKDLKGLLDDGVINLAEFEKEKQKILG
jgi:hypothetical protein